MYYLTPPKHSGELRVDLDHVWINLRGTWKRQKLFVAVHVEPVGIF
jgi:hypothetical protein